MHSTLMLFTTAVLSIAFSQMVSAAAPQARHHDSGMYTSFGGGSSSESGHQTKSPGQLLEQASQLGKDGRIVEAIKIANRAKKQAQHDPVFAINYIELLTQLANADGEPNSKILNIAIDAANKLHQTKTCNGQTDAELSYHFMVAIGDLADSVAPLNDKIACQLYAAQGNVARNLHNNPGYPHDSLEILGQPLVNLAKSYAFKKKSNAALNTLTEAFEIGYTEFDTVLEEPLFESVEQEALKNLVSEHQNVYRTKLEQWSRNELAKFKSLQVDYDVVNVNGGRISSEDTLGKVTVVDLWATWCQPCREGIPHFIELKKNFANKDINVIGISMDQPEDPAAAIDTVKSFGIDNDINYTLGVGTDAIKEQLPGKVLYPTTLFIDHKGTVRYIAKGYHDYDQLASITRLLDAEAAATKPMKTASR